MNEYLVFLGDDFYPCGGWEDFRGDFDSLEEALNYIKSQEPNYSWAHVVYKNKVIKTATTSTKDFKNHTWEFKDYRSD